MIMPTTRALIGRPEKNSIYFRHDNFLGGCKSNCPASAQEGGVFVPRRRQWWWWWWWWWSPSYTFLLPKFYPVFLLLLSYYYYLCCLDGRRRYEEAEMEDWNSNEPLSLTQSVTHGWIPQGEMPAITGRPTFRTLLSHRQTSAVCAIISPREEYYFLDCPLPKNGECNNFLPLITFFFFF